MFINESPNITRQRYSSRNRLSPPSAENPKYPLNRNTPLRIFEVNDAWLSPCSTTGFYIIIRLCTHHTVVRRLSWAGQLNRIRQFFRFFF